MSKPARTLLTFRGHTVNQNGITKLKLQFPASFFRQAIEMLGYIEQVIQVRLMVSVDANSGHPVDPAMSSTIRYERYETTAAFRRMTFSADGTAELWLESDTQTERTTKNFLVVAPIAPVIAQFKAIS